MPDDSLPDSPEQFMTTLNELDGVLVEEHEKTWGQVDNKTS